jgi:O-antigen ligase
MIFKTQTLSKLALFFIFFFTYMGFYASILFFTNISGNSESRLITIPIRVFVVFLNIFLIAVYPHKFKINAVYKYYLLFALIFICRILLEYTNAVPYYLSQIEVLLFFLSFSFIPFSILSNFLFSREEFNYINRALIYSGFLFSLLVLVFYGNYVGDVSRLSNSNEDDGFLSPLILSYNSIMIIGVFSYYLVYNKVSFYLKTIILISILISTVPFFLGASRGALVAIALPLLISFIFQPNYKVKGKFLFVIIAGFLLVFILNSYFNSGLLDRFFILEEDITDESNSAIRLYIWQKSFEQFQMFPFLGDKLAVNGWKNYPHNVILEVLQTTGIIGFIPFMILLIKVFKQAIKILKLNPSFAWISVIFFQAFVQNMFSGNLYTAAWLWASMALVIAFNRHIYRLNTEQL